MTRCRSSSNKKRADAGKALLVAECRRQRIQHVRFHSRQQPVPITLSCGVATMRVGILLPPRSNLPVARYQAKDGGRNRCAVLVE